MAKEREDGPDGVGLADFVVALIEGTAEAVQRAQIVQSEDESDLRALAVLDIEAAAERLVTAEAAQVLCDRLLTEAGVDSSGQTRRTGFVRLVEERLGVAFEPDLDYNERGLTPAGDSKLIDAAKRSIAAEQLQVVERLVREGTPRVKVGSGSLAAKVELHVDRHRTAGDDQSERTKDAQHGPVRSRLLRALGRGDDTPQGLQITVRPARQENGAAVGVFGQITINFVVV